MFDRFKVMLTPDAIQSGYLKYDSVDLQIDVMKFNDGSVRVVIPNMTDDLEHRYCHIEAFIQSLDDLMIISQIKDIIDRLSKSPKQYNLNITSTPYTRYDRVMFTNQTDGFGAKTFADFVNSLKFTSVSFLDSHSQVIIDLVNNAFDIPQKMIVSNMIDLDEYNLIAPDKGAVKKNPHADVIFDKVRNPETGQITGMQVSYFKPSDKTKYIVVDDICEGGRTFIECAKLFRDQIDQTGQLDLYVTHGIFSNGAICKLAEYYDNIYTYVMKKSLYDELDEGLKSKLHVKNLINL